MECANRPLACTNSQAKKVIRQHRMVAVEIRPLLPTLCCSPLSCCIYQYTFEKCLHLWLSLISLYRNCETVTVLKLLPGITLAFFSQAMVTHFWHKNTLCLIFFKLRAVFISLTPFFPNLFNLKMKVYDFFLNQENPFKCK